MFDKILIANRGEIALRVHRTCARLGIKSVAIFSDADKYGLHARTCDEAYRVGPPPARESYLDMDRIVEACKETGARAVHPGYGFLSENAKFAQRLAEEGITFIGPNPDVISMMGDKIAANRKAQEAGVPTVPGHWDTIPDADAAAGIASDIGYPVMLKAAAGGGGKGIRIANDEKELRDAFRLASSEARSAFGDDRVFIEKFIVRPRHIEIQVLGDTHGHVIHLGERECSIQRRHQKVIEEAPSPFVSEEMRRHMGEASVNLAKAVGYSSAGTVEYIVDQEGNFFFLEMNTRLQVEHAVTEMTTETDLVEWMIRVAAGEELTLAQSDIHQRGWAIEARIYAEDPNRGFLPSTGRVTRFSAPEESRYVRVDNSVYEGGEISLFYDPMIAKVTTWERERTKAVAEMRRALDEFYIKGVQHNIAFLTALMANPRFLSGDLTTGFINEEYPDGFIPAPLEDRDRDDIVAVAVLMHLRYVYRAARTSEQMPGYHRIVPPEWVAVVNGEFCPVTVSEAERGSEEGFDITYADHLMAVRSTWQIGDVVLRCTINGQPRRFKVERQPPGYHVYHLGAEIDVVVYRADVAEMLQRIPPRKPKDMSKYLQSPMPGLLRSIAVSVGEKVGTGDELAVVEAMKMENLLRATHPGKVKKIHAEEGDSLKYNQIILEFE
ncbi:MAG: acetyl-CoA carboxylase biotin carboxylase subunit [Alphaproteobacteria bacterium]|nr:acetyl-CoA carboxylase biotin carboxylase subunit [Alphaproteobacteria bacterium]